MIEHYQGQTGEVAKRPQQVHAFQKRWAEISWAQRSQHPQHAIEQSFDPHKGRAFYRQEDRRRNVSGEGRNYCTKSSISNAASIGAETASLAPTASLGSAQQCAKVLTEMGKNFAKWATETNHFLTMPAFSPSSRFCFSCGSS